MDHKQELIDLRARHKAQVEAAETAKAAGNAEEFGKALKAAQDLSVQIGETEELVKQQEIAAAEQKAVGETDAEKKDKALDRGEKLLKGDKVNYTVPELLAELKSTTLASGTLAKPTGIGQMHDAIGNIVTSLIDQVRVVALPGFGQILEPIEVSDMAAQSGAVASLAGTARTASDPTFTYAKIAPVEVDVTSFVDKNLKRLTPVDYEARIRGMALRALRRKIASFIMAGDGAVTPAMYGMKNAVDYNGTALYASLSATSIAADLLTDVVFAYGGNDSVGSAARLFLNKKDLCAIGKLRGSNEKKRLFEILFEGNGNTGRIVDGGTSIPFTIDSNLTALSETSQGAAAVQTMVYADPMNYELVLFGDYSVRVDESVKAVERMDAILGDAFVGGNLVVKNGAVVVTVPAQTQAPAAGGES